MRVFFVAIGLGLASSGGALADMASEEACDGVRVPVGLSGEKTCIKPGSGRVFKDCPDCPEMVVLPSGSFIMGSPKSEPERFVNEGPQHQVTITKPFAVGQFAVTRSQFAKFVESSGYKPDTACTGENKSWRSPGIEQGDDHPVVCVNWNDANAYAAWLTRTTGYPYRFLPEAEFEYAARAGTTTPYWWGAEIALDQASYTQPYRTEKRETTAPVKSFKPNPWGLYQVHGNVFTWTEDCYNDSYSDAPTDGSARTTGDCNRRAVRGGSWHSEPVVLRAAMRSRSKPGIGGSLLGFRLARTLNADS